MARARAGDLDAFEMIIRSRVDVVYRLSLAITGNETDAADAVQETWIAAWRGLGSLRDADRFEAWLRRITVNAARMVARSRRRRAVRELADIERLRETAYDETGPEEAERDGRRLDASLARLDPDRRALLALHHLDGLGLAEIAAAMNVPVGTVKSRLSTARSQLQRLLDEYDR